MAETKDYTSQIHAITSKWWSGVERKLERRCVKYCVRLCLEAIKERQQNKRAHNFTGNLLNSIVVCLYKNGKPVYAAYAAQYSAEAIQVKMRVRPSKLGYTAKMYRFRQDYDGGKSAYVPTVQTNGGWGVDDARDFFHSYRPEGKNLFDIVVVYPVEYATWIEYERQTTGIIQTHQYAQRVGVSFLKTA